jgi:hypothetical protein
MGTSRTSAATSIGRRRAQRQDSGRAGVRRRGDRPAEADLGIRHHGRRRRARGGRRSSQDWSTSAICSCTRSSWAGASRRSRTASTCGWSSWTNDAYERRRSPALRHQRLTGLMGGVPPAVDMLEPRPVVVTDPRRRLVGVEERHAAARARWRGGRGPRTATTAAPAIRLSPTRRGPWCAVQPAGDEHQRRDTEDEQERYERSCRARRQRVQPGGCRQDDHQRRQGQRRQQDPTPEMGPSLPPDPDGKPERKQPQVQKDGDHDRAGDGLTHTVAKPSPAPTAIQARARPVASRPGQPPTI